MKYLPFFHLTSSCKHPPQNLYTPLSQNMTDSDDNSSDEELHSTAAAVAARRKARLADRRRSMSAHHQPMRTASGTAVVVGGPSSLAGGGGAAAPHHHQHILDSLHQHGDGDADLAAHFASTRQHQHHHDARTPHSHHNSHPADAGMADDVAILAGKFPGSGGSGDYRRPPMGAVRRCLFVASIALCLLTVILFVWVVPCSDGGTCPARSERPRTRNWLRQYEGLELKGAINVVRGVRGRSNNLVFMYRDERLWRHRADNQSATPSTVIGGHRTRSGIISLVGSTGAVSWYDECAHEPAVIDCALIDADRNGVLDCLVLDVHGELGCLDPVSGTWLWRIAARSVSGAGLLSFPLVLPDWNGDGVGELLVTTSTPTNRTETATAATTAKPPVTGSSPYNTLIIVSGATGRTIGTPYVVRDCWFVHKFQLDAAAVRVSFNCIKQNGTEFQIGQTLDTLQRLITNRSSTAAKPKWTGGGGGGGATPIVQHKFYGQRRDTVSQRNIYAVAGKQLIVENAGKCPDACNVTVQLVEQRDGKEHVIRRFSGARMYGMVPALLSFNATAASGRRTRVDRPVHGFVIKFWQWAENDTDVRSRRERRQTTTSGEARSAWMGGVADAFADAEFNRFAHVMEPQSARWRYPEVMEPLLPVRLRRSTNVPPTESGGTVNGSQATGTTPPPRRSDAATQRLTMRVIRERVVLIVFNSTDTRIENTSQSNIVQFCRRDDEPTAETTGGGAESASASVSCQPDLNYQENSVLIADLDEDGSQELVTYYTTYVNAAAAGDAEPATTTTTMAEWRLVNYVQLLRLEAELPKLYVVDGGEEATTTGRV